MNHNTDNDNLIHPHLLPFRLYVTVLVILLTLTFITVAVSRFDFGMWNIVVAMLIASIKAGVVALFFMHLKYENPLTWMYVGIPLIILALLLLGIFIDNPYRLSAHGPGYESGAAYNPAEKAEAHH
jgi:cytochrome c oxidase subunit 4